VRGRVSCATGRGPGGGRTRVDPIALGRVLGLDRAPEVKTIRRKHDEYQAKADELDRNIDVFLKEGRDDLATAAQSKLNSTQRLVDSYTQQLDQMQREYQSLMDARLKLEAKLTTIKQEREELSALLELAKSKELTAKTVKSLDDLAGTGDADVARIADSIRTRLDRASAETEMRAASLDKQMDDVLDRNQLDAQLAARHAAGKGAPPLFTLASFGGSTDPFIRRSPENRILQTVGREGHGDRQDGRQGREQDNPEHAFQDDVPENESDA